MKRGPSFGCLPIPLIAQKKDRFRKIRYSKLPFMVELRRSNSFGGDISRTDIALIPARAPLPLFGVRQIGNQDGNRPVLDFSWICGLTSWRGRGPIQAKRPPSLSRLTLLGWWRYDGLAWRKIKRVTEAVRRFKISSLKLPRHKY